MGLSVDELQDLAGADARPDFEWEDLMNDAQEASDIWKTATVPESKDFFSVNDIVLFGDRGTYPDVPLIGVVARVEGSDLYSTQMIVLYYEDKKWSKPGAGTTHYSNVRWIGNLERHGLTWEDLK